jgi:hypothetical protein
MLKTFPRDVPENQYEESAPKNQYEESAPECSRPQAHQETELASTFKSGLTITQISIIQDKISIKTQR